MLCVPSLMSQVGSNEEYLYYLRGVRSNSSFSGERSQPSVVPCSSQIAISPSQLVTPQGEDYICLAEGGGRGEQILNAMFIRQSAAIRRNTGGNARSGWANHVHFDSRPPRPTPSDIEAVAVSTDKSTSSNRPGDESAVWKASHPRMEEELKIPQRVTINVSGMIFETWLEVLERHPVTLLGDPVKRSPFYDSERREYFFDRHRPTFEAVFNYYQYGGKLKRPMHVPDEIFLSEMEFYQIEKEVVDVYKRDEGYVTEELILPENKIQRTIWMLFEFPETSALAFIIAVISVLFTLISIVLFCVETLPYFSDTHCDPKAAPNFTDVFFIIETLCTCWFTIELIVRFFSCPSKRMYMKDVKNAIDIAAVVPYYVTLTTVLVTYSCEGAKGSASLAFLRVIRLIRIFKLTKHSSGLQVLVLTFRASIEGLGLFLVALIVCILVFSSTIYYVEVGVKDSQIESIPDAFWWAVITMCTVGYGDIVPKGYLGKLVGSVCALTGVLTLAIPVPIITENFNKFYAHKTGRGRL